MTISEARAKLGRVRNRLFKRRARVRFCKARQRYWRKKLEAQQDASRNIDRPVRKLAYWNEQLDKAILGRKGLTRLRKRLEKKLRFLKRKAQAAQPAPGVVVAQAPWNPYGRPVARWIAEWLEKSYRAGWRGYVTSGWRDPAYSESLCYNMCGAPSCPGRCAGRSSNHSGSIYPAGAVDVTSYYTFAAIQVRIGSPLHNSLGAQDPVHFSYSGR